MILVVEFVIFLDGFTVLFFIFIRVGLLFLSFFIFRSWRVDLYRVSYKYFVFGVMGI